MGTRKSKQQQLQALWATIPRIACRQLCQRSCGPIGCSREERRLLVKATGRAPATDANHQCVLLEDGRCRGYEVRPTVCRLYGVVETMPCPFGCIPERWLTVEEGHALINAARVIGGRDAMIERQVQRDLAVAVAFFTGQQAEIEARQQADKKLVLP